MAVAKGIWLPSGIYCWIAMRMAFFQLRPSMTNS